MKKITLNKKHKLIIGITTVILLAGGLGGYAMYTTQVQAAEVDEAQKAVQSLFSDTKQTKLANDITEHELEKVTREVDEVKNTSEKKELQISLDSAESMLKNQKDAEKAVINLYQQDDKTKFADTVSNDTIKHATDLTSKVTNDKLKKELTTQVADIDKKYKAYQTADKATNALFEDSKKTALKDTTKQANLDAVKKQVNVIANDSKKTTVAKNLTKAQDLLNQRNQAEKKAEVAKQQEIVEEQTEALDQTQNGTEGSGSSDQSGNEGAGNDNASNSSSSTDSSKSSSSDSSSSSESYGGGSSKKSSNGSSSSSKSSSSSSSSKGNSNSSSGSSSTGKNEKGGTNYNINDDELTNEGENENGGTDYSWGW